MYKNLVLVVGLCGESVFMKVDHFHQDGETIVIDEIHKEPGGKGYNQAITVKSLGVDTAFIGAIGDDSSGIICSDYLDDKGLINSLIVKENNFSAYATIMVDKTGNNHVSVYPGASTLLSVEDIENCEELFTKSKYILLQFEVSSEVLKKCIELANKHDVKIIVNPAPHKESCKHLINQAYVITPNFHEAKQLFNLGNISVEDLASKLCMLGVNNIVVTLGKDGALVIENNIPTYIPPLIIDQSVVIDTTGAGDVFNGALVVGLYKNMSLQEASKFAMKASSYSIKKPYVMSSIPTVGDIDE